MERVDARADTFGDELREWSGRSPFLAIAIAIHMLALFALNAIPWHLFEREEPHALVAELPPPPDQVFEEPIDEAPQEILEPEVTEPVVRDDQLVEEDLAFAEDEAEADTAPSPFPNDAPATIGVGPGGALGGGPPGMRRSGYESAPSDVQQSIAAGLDWLARHQDPSGAWRARDFGARCEAHGGACLGEGDALHDVGVTALALLAFLGAGETPTRGRYAEEVRRAVGWLVDQQDRATGLVGPATAKEHAYDHAIATLALAEAQIAAPSPLVLRATERAVARVLAARNDYGAWRYAMPPDGQSDTSVTGWMVFALAAAQHAGVEVGTSALEGALAFLDEVTDPATGRAGYTERGTGSSRLAGLADEYPAEATESLTAVAMLSRVFLHDLLDTSPAADPLLELGAERLMEHLPEWDPAGGGASEPWSPGDHGATNDMYYWYYGTYALYQVGGTEWRAWRAAMERAILRHQRSGSQCHRGSWDPSGPWGSVGGRVYSTALMVLCVEVYFRYGRILGSR